MIASVGMVPAAAYACSVDVATAGTSITASFDNVTSPDVILVPFGRGSYSATYLRGCSNYPSFPVTLTPASGGLTYVRDVQIDGESHPAYGWHASSPLIAFRYRLQTNYGIVGEGPLSMDRPTQVAAGVSGPNGFLSFVVDMALISRGGGMTGSGRTSLGTVEATFTRFPGLQLTNRQSGDIDRLPDTCFLEVPTTTLRDVSQSEMPNPGDTAAETDFEVLMYCEASGLIDLSVSDANAPGNRTDQLVPTADSGATGVRTQILRSGVPMTMGTKWEFGNAQSGSDYYIPFSARYIRTADAIGPGIIKGEVVLSATYR